VVNSMPRIKSRTKPSKRYAATADAVLTPTQRTDELAWECVPPHALFFQRNLAKRSVFGHRSIRTSLAGCRTHDRLTGRPRSAPRQKRHHGRDGAHRRPRAIWKHD